MRTIRPRASANVKAAQQKQLTCNDRRREAQSGQRQDKRHDNNFENTKAGKKWYNISTLSLEKEMHGSVSSHSVCTPSRVSRLVIGAHILFLVPRATRSLPQYTPHC